MQTTGLHLSAYFGIEKAARILVGSMSRGVEDGYGRMPLSWAAEREHEAVVKLLLAQDGVDPESKDTSPRALTVGRRCYGPLGVGMRR
jgi:ankyrin repeat protein